MRLPSEIVSKSVYSVCRIWSWVLLLVNWAPARILGWDLTDNVCNSQYAMCKLSVIQTEDYYFA